MAKYIGVLPSVSRTTDQRVEIFNYDDPDGYTRMHLVIDITSGKPNLVVKISGVDSASGKDYLLLASPTLNASGVTTIMKVGPEQTTGTNAVKDVIPARMAVTVTQSGGVPITYSLGASLI